MSFFSKLFKNKPPKTTFKNFTYIPHLERLLLWFLLNDPFFKTIKNKAVHTLFQEGWWGLKDNPNLVGIWLKEPEEQKTVERFLILKTWLDLITASKVAEKEEVELKETLNTIIDDLDKQGEKTLISTGKIAHKYNLDVGKLNLDSELPKIKSELEKISFKTDFLADAIISSEIRLLAWIYKELFGENYQIKK